VKLTGPRPFPGAPPSTWPADWPPAGSVSWAADELPRIAAAGTVDGLGYPAGTHQPALRHVQDIGGGRVLVEGASVPAVDAPTPP